MRVGADMAKRRKAKLKRCGTRKKCSLKLPLLGCLWSTRVPRYAKKCNRRR